MLTLPPHIEPEPISFTALHSSALGFSPVARSTQASEHAEHVQPASWGGIHSSGSQTISSGGSSSASSKGTPLGAVVLLEVEVDAVGSERPRDLVALVHDHVLLVRPRLRAVFFDQLGHARPDVPLGHQPSSGRIRRSVLARQSTWKRSCGPVSTPASSKMPSSASWSAAVVCWAISCASSVRLCSRCSRRRLAGDSATLSGSSCG